MKLRSRKKDEPAAVQYQRHAIHLNAPPTSQKALARTVARIARLKERVRTMEDGAHKLSCQQEIERRELLLKAAQTKHR